MYADQNLLGTFHIFVISKQMSVLFYSKMIQENANCECNTCLERTTLLLSTKDTFKKTEIVAQQNLKMSDRMCVQNRIFFSQSDFRMISVAVSNHVFIPAAAQTNLAFRAGQKNILKLVRVGLIEKLFALKLKFANS